MKFKLLLMMLVLTNCVLAKTVTSALIEEEIMLAIQISDTYQVPVQVNGPCKKSYFDVVKTTKGFNPSKWTLNFDEKIYSLDSEFISGIMELHNRLQISSEEIDSITLSARITIISTSCGFSPNKWTVSFEDKQND